MNMPEGPILTGMREHIALYLEAPNSDERGTALEMARDYLGEISGIRTVGEDYLAASELFKQHYREFTQE